VTVVRDPCSDGEVTLTVTPGSALPSWVTAPVSEPVVPWAKSEDAARRKRKHTTAMWRGKVFMHTSALLTIWTIGLLPTVYVRNRGW
jgi:hypothetical protein